MRKLYCSISIIAMVMSGVSACQKGNGQMQAGEQPDVNTSLQRYGYPARIEAQEQYFRELGNGDYITPQRSWDEKLEQRKQSFNNNLKREYLSFAKRLNSEKNHTDASFFRRKGLDAEKADFDVMPESPEKWSVKDENELEQLNAARTDLLDALTGYTPITAPVEAAKSLVYYDCWIQQSQMIPGDKHDCKSKFIANYRKLNSTADSIEGKNIVEINKQYKWVSTEKPIYDAEGNLTSAKDDVKRKPVSVPVAGDIGPKPPKPAANSSLSNAGIVGPNPQTGPAKQVEDKTLITDQSDKTPDLLYIAYFNEKNDGLSDAAKAELDKAVAEIKKNNPKSVSVNGHTDRSVDNATSLILSKKRADNVRSYLISKGISRNIINTYGFGKTDNLVENAEGEAKPANQRVEVIFKAPAAAGAPAQ